MITFSITHQKDEGDRIVFYETPLWRDVIDTIVGKYQPRWGWDYIIWNRILIWTTKKDRNLHWVPLDNPCLFSQKVWNDEPCDAENECKNCTPRTKE